MDIGGEITDIFLGGLSKAVDGELSERFGVRDPSAQYEGDAGSAESTRKGQTPAPGLSNTVMIIAALGVVGLAFVLTR